MTRNVSVGVTGAKHGPRTLGVSPRRSAVNPLPLLPVVLVGAASALQEIVLTAAPQGLQGGSRRNAWLAVADDDVRARDRAEAADALGLALVGPLLRRAAGS
jgi:hypothetical protein